MLTLCPITDLTSLQFTEFIHQHYVFQCLISIYRMHFYHLFYQINFYDVMKKIQGTNHRQHLGNLQTVIIILRTT